jgi:predicted RNase H-like HicB family nuclease
MAVGGAVGAGEPRRRRGRGYNGRMITNYVAAALRRARYQNVDGGLVCATVPGLRGVMATAATVEGCRSELAEVIEAWILVRVSRGLSIPSLGRTTVAVKRAS